MTELKVGFIVCASHKDGIVDLNGDPYVNRDLIIECQNKLYEMGVKCIEHSVVVASKQEAKEAFSAMAVDEEIHSVIIFIGTWNWVANLTAAIRHFSFSNKGILLWVHPGAQGWRTGAGLLVHGALKEIGLKHKLVYGDRNDSETQKDIFGFILANQIKADLSMSTFCLFGGRGQAQACGSVDPSQWMRQFGIDIDAISPLEVYERVKNISEEDVKKNIARIQQFFSQELKQTQANIKAVKLYIALKELIDKNGYLGIGVQNFPGIADYYTIPSLAQSMLIEDGIGNSALGDMNVALSTFILLRASGQAVFYGDIQNIEVETNTLKIVADGSAAPTLAASEYPAAFADRGIEHEGDGGGLTVSLVCKEGEGVLAKIIRDNGKNQMVLARCSVFVPDKSEIDDLLRECGIPFWPHAFTKVHGDIIKLIHSWGGEYICLAYGDKLYETLVNFCDVTDIELIQI